MAYFHQGWRWYHLIWYWVKLEYIFKVDDRLEDCRLRFECADLYFYHVCVYFTKTKPSVSLIGQIWIRIIPKFRTLFHYNLLLLTTTRYKTMVLDVMGAYQLSRHVYL